MNVTLTCSLFWSGEFRKPVLGLRSYLAECNETLKQSLVIDAALKENWTFTGRILAAVSLRHQVLMQTLCLSDEIVPEVSEFSSIRSERVETGDDDQNPKIKKLSVLR